MGSSKRNTRNVTERKRAKESISYRAHLVEDVSDAIISTDLDFNIRSWNKAAETIYGWQADEVIGKPVVKVTKLEYPYDSPDDVLKEFSETGRWKGEVVQKRKDDTTINVLASVSLIKDKMGHPVGAVAINRDVTERKRMEKSAEEDRGKYHALFRQARDGIALIDAETGGIVDANAEFERQTGRNIVELRATKIWEIRPPDKVEVARRKFLEIRGKGTGGSAELDFQRPNGEIVPVEFVGSKITVGGKEYIQSISRDITERKRMEQALRESEELHRVTLTNMSDAVFITDRAGAFTFICPNAAVIFGYTAEEVAERSNISFLLGSAVFDVDELGTKGEVPNIERVITDKTGEQHTLLVTVKRVDIKGGTVLYTCRDITKRRRMEQALQESQRDLNHAQAVAQTGSWRLDVRRNELLWSDENHRLFGIPKGTPMTYETFLSTVHPEDREYVDGKWKAALHGEPYDIEHRIVVGNEIKWVRERTELEFDPQGMLKGGFGTAQDITEHKQVEKMKEEFIGLVSHELRTPLTIVIGSLRTAMSEGIPPEDMRMLLQNADEGAHFLANILENMLELARHQVGRLQLHMESVGIADVTKLVVKKLKGQGASQQFLMDFPVDLPSVAGDPLRVERVLYNLVENATKYSPAQSEIKIFARKEKDFVVTGVTDQGRGISLDDMDKLFEPFQQLERGSQSSQGLGLGLVVCKRLVESQGGWTKVDSGLGRGSTFSFALPIDTKTE